MSDKYILRSGAIDAIKRNAGTLYTREAEFLLQKVIFLLKHATASDVAEVVRCKDCIRRYDTDECPMCFLIEGKYYEYTNENGFCDRGERKEGAE